MGQNKWWYSKKIHVWNRVRLSLRGKKIIVNQILLSKLWCIGQIYPIPKYIKTEIEKRIYNFLWNRRKYNLPNTCSTLYLEGWIIYFRHRYTIKLLNYIEIKCIQMLINPTNALEKDFMLYRLKLILNSDQDLILLRQKRILTGLIVTTTTYKHITMKISLFNYSMIGYI